jgi:uncharacterized protein
MPDTCLIVMVKCPRKGQVKNRLSLSIGDDNAVEIYRRSALDLLDTLDAMVSPQFDLLIGFHPPDASEDIDSWIGTKWKKIPQSGNDLGEKQVSLLKKAFEYGYSAACVMTSDAPDIPALRFKDAIEKLSQWESVIGPSTDGGYFLIGFTKEAFVETPFLDMVWSHPGVTHEMKNRLEKLGIRWTETAAWPDLDNIDDVKALLARHPKGIESVNEPKRTLSFLRRLDLP